MYQPGVNEEKKFIFYPVAGVFIFPTARLGSAAYNIWTVDLELLHDVEGKFDITWSKNLASRQQEQKEVHNKPLFHLTNILILTPDYHSRYSSRALISVYGVLFEDYYTEQAHIDFNQGQIAHPWNDNTLNHNIRLGFVLVF